MSKLLHLLTLITLTLISHSLYADRTCLNLVQIYQPKDNWIDINFYPLFFLHPREEETIKKISNRYTLFTHNELSRKSKVMKLGELSLNINSVRLKQESDCSSSHGIIITVRHRHNRVLDRVIIKEEEFSGITLIHSNNKLILSLKTNVGTKEENYEVKTNLAKPLMTYEAIKSNGKALTSFIRMKKPFRTLNMLSNKAEGGDIH